jgi:diguanylate cyclase (GGDEF)-like protein/PAS domain S-box-containing protein
MANALAQTCDATGAVARPSATAEEALLELLYLTPVALIRFRPDGRIDLANPEAARLLMPLTDDADMTNFYQLMHRLMPDLRQRVGRFAAPFGQICQQVRLHVPGGATMLMLTVNKLDPATLMAVVQDITQIMDLRTRHSHDQRNLQAVYEHVDDYAVCKLGVDGRLLEWNTSLARLGGWQQGELTAISLETLVPLDQVTPAAIADFLHRARHHGSASVECWNARKNGSRFWASIAATVLPDSEGRPAGFVLVIHDLTLQRQMREVQHLAATDSLTGALNRRAGIAAVEAAYGLFQQVGRDFSVILVDIDYFKQVNDTLGHDGGDQVLVAAVKLMRGNLRDGDCTIRWGGEEFLLLLPGAGMAAAHGIAERIRAAIEAARIVVGGRTVTVTISAGVSQVRRGCRNVEDIIREADEALYAAKRGGRNQIRAAKEVVLF